jgi:uncharacterized protein (TIGR02145 family)
MKNSFIVTLVAVSVIICTFILIPACKKEDATTIPSVSTLSVRDITQTTAKAGGHITSDGGSDITARGVCWGINNTPTINDNKTIDGSDLGSYFSEITELEPNTTYFARAYAANAEGIAYGSIVSFTTLEAILPVLTTSDPAEITINSAICGGNILDDGFALVSARGIVFDTLQHPSIQNSLGVTIDGEGIGEFTSHLTSLTPGRTYYVKAYATNEIGTAYGSQKSFSTISGSVSLFTSEITEITLSSALGGGNIIDDGGADIKSRGVVWSISPNPDLNDNYTEDGTGTGSFESVLTNLTIATVYYVRAYATNDAGTSFGDEKSFTTRDGIIILNTTPPDNITYNSARSGGSITTDGGSPIHTRGLVWSTYEYPTLTENDGITINGSGIGNFSGTLTDLLSETTYYVRAYAINNVEAAYGNQHSFNTDFLCGSSTVIDFDGNIYNTTQISNRCWMVQNLRTIHYRNGVPIENITGNDEWQEATTGAYAWYENDEYWKSRYGALYNWYAVNNGNGLCPVGWHVPFEDEWSKMTNDLLVVYGVPWESRGKVLKSCRQLGSPIFGCNTGSHPRWDINANHFGTDDFGFSGLPAGYRFGSGQSNHLGRYTEWWSATLNDAGDRAWIRSLHNHNGFVGRTTKVKNWGLSVRCIKDL